MYTLVATVIRSAGDSDFRRGSACLPHHVGLRTAAHLHLLTGMTEPAPSSDDQALELSVEAMYGMVEALSALCDRLRSEPAPLDPDSFDRLLMLVSSMLSDAQRLCATTQVLDVSGRPGSSNRIDAGTYEELGQALTATRSAVKVLLERHRPNLADQAEAASVLTRIASAARDAGLQ